MRYMMEKGRNNMSDIDSWVEAQEFQINLDAQ